MGTKNVVVKVTPKNGTCSGTQLSKTVVYKASGCAKEDAASLQMEEDTKNITLEVYPNPAQDRFSLKISGLETDEAFMVKWYDLTGRLLRTDEKVQTGSGTEVLLDRGNIPAGVYVLRMESPVRSLHIRLTLE